VFLFLFRIGGNMKKVFAPFNLYFSLAIILAGCATSEKAKEKKEQSTVRLHLEVPATDERSGTVLVTKQRIPLNVEREPFLTEGELHHAEIVASPGGFAIALNFGDHGAFQLDMVSTSNKGRRVAVLVQFPESHWVGAPVLTHRIQNGVFVFTPDLTIEESRRVVRGLNNVAEKARKGILNYAQ
jgi:hypothetical protein